MPDTTVKYFNSAMSGAPTLSGAVGTLVGVCDACLVNGFGSVTLTSLVVYNNVATATYNSGHKFAMVGNTGPVITIAGATPSGLNGEWRITVTSSTQFTFATSGISDQTATGTITANRAPAGFSVAYSGTNDKSYRANDLTGSRNYLRIQDSAGYEKTAIIALYEDMTAWNTGTNRYGMYLEKSMTQDATARAWSLFADHKSFHLIINNGDPIKSGMFFGDIISYKAGDGYYGCIVANSINSYANNDFYYAINNPNGHIIVRSYTQTGSYKNIKFHSHSSSTSFFGNAGVTYPNPVDNNLIVWPIDIWENSSPPVIRGIWPGAYSPLLQYTTITDETIVSASRDMIVKNFGTGALAYDITGPWR